MKYIDAKDLHYKELNKLIRYEEDTHVTLTNVMGQRFIGCALEGKNIDITGIPGNALGACLNGGSIITVHNNCQDATGDTMDDGEIIVHGNSGDTAGYAMRGGKILIKESGGYRMGLHMKAYNERQPLMIVGNRVGSFCGEYLAGGTIIVLGYRENGNCPVGNFCGTGMYGGRIFLRSNELPKDLSPYIDASVATIEELESIREEVTSFCSLFDITNIDLDKDNFYILSQSKVNEYKKKYTTV
ncbi:MAG: glutamate synthase [Spirochaetaceae bacterium]|nr:glutamate synthase [Spirochaetaceae bacterium]